MNQIPLFNNSEEIQPEFRVRFKLLLSLNDLSSADKFDKGKLTKTWRSRGCNRVLERARFLDIATEDFARWVEKPYRGKDPRQKGIPVRIMETGTRLKSVYFTEPVVLVVRLWKANATTFDVHNLVIKHVVDGFVDAGLLPDDNVNFMPLVIYKFEGIDSRLVLSKEKKAERAELKRTSKKHRYTPPANKRILFDFWRLKTLTDEPEILTKLLLNSVQHSFGELEEK